MAKSLRRGHESTATHVDIEPQTARLDPGRIPIRNHHPFEFASKGIRRWL
jgi:hypothetical protein